MLTLRACVRRAIHFTLVATGILALAPAASAQDPLTIGYYDNPPLSHVSPLGEPDGLFINLVDDVAATLGWDVRWRLVDFAAGLQAAEDGHIDALAVVAETPARAETLIFPDEPVVSNWAQIYAAPRVAPQTLLDLRDRRVAAVGGDVYLDGPNGLRVLLTALDTPARITTLRSFRDAVAAVALGEADVALVSRFAGQSLARARGLEPTPIIFSPVALHVALSPRRPDARALAAGFDAELRTLKRDPNSAYQLALDQTFTGGAPTRVNTVAITVAIIAAILLAMAVFAALRFRRMERRMAELALTDPLTHAPNRRAFMAAAQREFSRVKRGEQALAIALIDLDHFKVINDTHGHDAGDEVLRDAVLAMGELLRAADFFGRIGGEEFAILLPATDLMAALTVAEKLRAGFEARSVRAGANMIHYAASIGVTEVTGRDPRFEAALKRADQAVYLAKTNGRNRVESF